VFAEGRQEGRQQGGSAVLLRQLRRRFGVLDAPRVECIQALSIPQLDDLAEALLDFKTLDDLDAWLQSH
jgi:hypothetical protein